MELIFGDCIEEMAKMEPQSIDAVVCDLPYYKVVDDEFDNQWATEQDYLNWVRSLIVQYSRILKPNGNIFIFTSRQYNRYICMMLDEFFNERRIIIWCRKRSFNSTRGKALASGYEPIAYYCNGDDGTFNNIKVKPDTKRKEYTDGMLKDGVTLSDVWTDIPALPHNSKEKVAHPTQKPLALMERIISVGTNNGDVVLDNCMGSGTTGVACANLNRNFIGIESNEEYFRIAEKRIGDCVPIWNI
jgi:DNA modification methylase